MAHIIINVLYVRALLLEPATICEMTKSLKHPLAERPAGEKRNYNTGYAMTYVEIAERLGISKEGVRQIEIRALRKLKKGMEESGITWDDFVDVIGKL